MRTTAIVSLAVFLVLGTAVHAFAEGENDSFGNALEIASLPFTDSRSTVGATRDALEPQPCGAIGATVWYRFVADASKEVIVDTLGSSFDTVLAVYDGTSPFDLELVECADDSAGNLSIVRFSTFPGRTYYLQVGGYYGRAGTLVFSLAEPSSIGGTITNAAGEPVPDVCVEVYDLKKHKVGTSFTDVLGDYTVGGIPGGFYKIRYTDCGDYGDGSQLGIYSREYWDNKASFATGDALVVAKGTDATGIDVLLELRPRPDVAITNMTIEDESIRTSQGDAPAATGWTRTITVDSTNLGNVQPRSTTIVVEACPRTIGSCKTIGSERVDLPPGGSVRRTFTWVGVDTIGDVTVTAIANTTDDSDWNNNTYRMEHYVQAGGTGIGVGPGCVPRTVSYLPTICTPF